MSPELGPIARRLKQLAERGQEVARDERKQTMLPGPGIVLVYGGRKYTLPELTEPGNEAARAEHARRQILRGQQLMREARER